MLIEIKSGRIKKGDSIISCAFGKKYDIFEVKSINFIYNF
jgi:hypothetical protein